MSAQHAPEPWWADWNMTVNDAKQYIAYRQIAAEYRVRVKNAGTDITERNVCRGLAAAAQKKADDIAETLRWCAGQIERAAIAKATGSAKP